MNVWPADLRWVPEQLGITRGTPRFIVVRGDKVLLHKFGRRTWSTDVLPLIERSVPRRAARATSE